MNIRLEDIIIYPIKSLGKISLKMSEARIRGLKFDRRMMLTDGNGHFLTQRRIPEMARLNLSLNDKGFMVQHEGEETYIPFNLTAKNSRKVTIWDDEFLAPEAEGYYSRWFSEHLNHECHLILMDDETIRRIKNRYAVYSEEVSYADGFPYLIIGTGSLEDLNQRLEIPVPMDRFRPNLVISTDRPFTEDELDIFQIGEAVFKRVKPCSRCVVTTIDQLTGERSKEPLKTLSEYRKVDQNVYFGQNLICLREGLVKKGDILYQLSNYDIG
jgi:uncharacterized protein YcbX